MARSLYPFQLDVFMPLSDGLHPVSEVDHNLVGDAITNIEEVLGRGTSPTYGAATKGPKGLMADVAERLALMFEEDGGVRDIAFVHGEAVNGQFSEKGSGLFIPFGKSIRGATIGPGGYVVVFQSGGNLDQEMLASWWVARKDPEGCFIKARTTITHALGGGYIEPGSSHDVTYSLLAFGPGAAE